MNQTYLQTGNPNELRVRGSGSNWWIEVTDNNNVWVAAEPSSFRYASKMEALDVAQELATLKSAIIVE